jgi:serine/threonine-protein kinase
MSLTAGTRIGHYEVTAQIGVGGRGEVYRAFDGKLNRDVALKILPEALARDVDRVARFRREAQVLASLNHPNIAAIYGLEDSGSVHALVLELVEGPTLAEIIAAPGPRDAAPDATPSLLQTYGGSRRARATGREAHPPGCRSTKHSPSRSSSRRRWKRRTNRVSSIAISSRRTSRSRPTASSRCWTSGWQRRWAQLKPESPVRLKPDTTGVTMTTGATTYGMAGRSSIVVSGFSRTSFAGDDVSDTLANVLKREPDWSALPTDVPPAIRALLRRCLEMGSTATHLEATGPLRATRPTFCLWRDGPGVRSSLAPCTAGLATGPP